MNHDYHVQAHPQGKRLVENQVAELPFQPVPYHSPLQPSTGPEPHARHGLLVGERADGELQPLRPVSSTGHGTKGVRTLERDELGGSGVRQAGMSCQRPFCRRRLSVRLPPRVLMRWRNPCVLFRLRFERFVRCFFIVAIIRLGRGKAKEKSLERLEPHAIMALLPGENCLCTTCGNCG